MDSLAALLAEADALDKAATPGPWEWSAKGRGPRRLQESDGGDEIAWASEERGICFGTHGNDAFIARARTLLPALATALRPFTAPVGVEAFEGLRREHNAGHGLSYSNPCPKCSPSGGNCTCRADEANALLDQCIAAHVAALGEVERLRAENARLAADIAASETALRALEHERSVDASHLTALRSAILDGPDPSGCPDCGSLDCDRPAAQAAMGVPPTPDEYDAAVARLTGAMATCGERPAVDLRAQLAKVREVAR